MADRLSSAGVQRGRPSGRRPPIRKGGAFLGSSFGDERRMTSRQTAGHLPPKACAFFPHRLFGDVKQRNGRAVAPAGKPPDPAQRKTIKCNFYRLLPGPPRGPGVQVLPQRENNGIRQKACKEKASVYRSCCRTFHPACKVRPGAAGSEMACRLSMAGVLGGRPPSRRPPVRKGGAFLGSSFGDERRIAFRQAAGHLPPKKESPRQTAGNLLSKK